MSSPEITKTDTEIVIKFPKHSDLDIKFYNPEIIQSLGFVGATVHLDTLETPGEQQTGGGLLDYESTPEQPVESLSYPYRYFAYMFRSINPTRKEEPKEEPVKPKEETQPSGLMGTIMSLTSGEKKSQPEPTPSAGFFSMFLNKKDLTKNATVVKETTIVEPTNGLAVSSSLPSEETPTKEEPSLMDSLFTPSSVTTTPSPIASPEETPIKETSLMDSLFPPSSVTTTPSPIASPEETPTKEEPSLMDSLFPSSSVTTTPSPIASPEETPTKETSLMDSPVPSSVAESPSIMTEEPPDVVSSSIPDPVVSSVPETPTEPPFPVPFAPVVTPLSAKWVIHIPLASNPVDEVDGIAETDNAAFDDVLVFAQMEARNGIYVRGEFIDVLGKSIKIGSVEQLSSGENNRTIKEYLSGRTLLEGTKMQKYSMLMNE